MVLRFESRACALDSLSAQFKRIWVVGTLSTLHTIVLIGCFPGPSGSAQIPFLPLRTILAFTSELVVSSPSSPTKLVTTPHSPIFTSTIGTWAIDANQGLMA